MTYTSHSSTLQPVYPHFYTLLFLETSHLAVWQHDRPHTGGTM